METVGLHFFIARSNKLMTIIAGIKNPIKGSDLKVLTALNSIADIYNLEVVL